MHVMLDLETMGTGPTAAIVSIGAVEFDPTTCTMGREFYRTVDLQSCIDAELTVDGSTVNWWLGQSEGARQALLKDATPLRQVLTAFELWFDPNAWIWSHGASFDLPILKNAFTALGTGWKAPWQYKYELDTRTVLWMTGYKMSTRVGIAHNALDDAKNQAIDIMNALKGTK